MEKLRLCYYGELDPFTGMADEGPGSLDALIADLTVLSLLYDAVIVPPENLLPHPLALPAFEVLAPLVRAGRLATSGAPSSPGLHAFIRDTADLHRQTQDAKGRPVTQRGPRSRYARRQREIDEVVARWCAVLPERWPFLRDVPGQLAGFTERLRRFCEAPHLAEASRRGALRFMDEEQQAGKPGVVRSELLAQVAALCAEGPKRDRDLLTLISQAAYFTMGSEGHRPAAVGGEGKVCTLFPGRFAGYLQQHATLVAADTVPPYDWQVTPARVAGRMRAIGLEPGSLAGIDAQTALGIAASDEWRDVRAFLVASAPGPEIEHAARERLLADREIGEALAGGRGDRRRRGASGPRRPVVLPARWQLATQVALGARLAEAPPGAGPVLDLDRIELRDGARREQLTRARADLVSLLVIRGRAGVSADDLKQLTREREILGAGAGCLVPESWHARVEPRESAAGDRARRARIDKLKKDTGPTLESIGFGIETERGHGLWRLADRLGGERRLDLQGGVWTFAHVDVPPPEAPAGLTDQQKQLWSVLRAAHPAYVSRHTLAAALGKGSDDKRGLQQATDAMYKLARALENLGATWRVARPQPGLYVLCASGRAQSEVG